MINKLHVIAICTGLLTTAAVAQSALKTQKEKAGYIIGIEMAKQLIVSKDDLDLDAMKLGMQDVFSGAKPKLSPEEMRTAMQAFQESKKKNEVVMMKRLMDANKKEGRAFLAANKKKKGVTTLPSGLQYKVIKSGSGKSPKLTDTVVTHYHGTLIDGTVFDSSYDRGEAVSFPINGVIKGWTEALQKMKVGDKWQLVIPSELAYGDRGAPPSIVPGATLLFDVELLKIKR
ncbi:MAG: FKBP-type peptidyl-prolyl cis-trans isomerase [Campylobacterota bacterium]|nr:FKBP-type peptidyl-prolyl cis-trans isomerase [Campylobacterota bacterium]